MNQQEKESHRQVPSLKSKLWLAPALLLTIASVIYAQTQTQTQTQRRDTCVECHSHLEARLSAPVTQMNDSIHHQRGLSCNDCHGGDPTQEDQHASMDASKGYIGRPQPSQIPAFCGKCHADAYFMKKFNPALRVDQESEYFTSMHGKRLQSGDQHVATCISCHSTHNIRAVSDPLSSVYATNVAETCAKCHANADYMREYQIPTDQYANYKTSVHAAALYERQDVSAPTCNDCHGNHGATPPGVASVANVCGQCHGRQSELFQASPHKRVFDERQIGECIGCHSNHGIKKPSDLMLGVAEGSVCIKCHKQGDAGFAVAGAMRSRIDELSASISHSEEILNRAERAGMEVSRPKFELREAVDALTNSRVVIHTSSTAEVEKITGPGLEVAKKGYRAGVAALDERSYRRKGLAVSLVFIFFLAALIYLKVREIESRQALSGSVGN